MLSEKKLMPCSCYEVLAFCIKLLLHSTRGFSLRTGWPQSKRLVMGNEPHCPLHNGDLMTMFTVMLHRPVR